MGLDNGFELRNKNAQVTYDLKYGFPFEIGYFRKYYELDDFMRSHCKRVDQNSDYEYVVTYDALKQVRDNIEPIYMVLITMSDAELDLLEDEGLSAVKRVENEPALKNEDNPFSVVHSSSAFATGKLIRLYHVVNVLMDCIDMNGDIEIIFYSSY